MPPQHTHRLVYYIIRNNARSSSFPKQATRNISIKTQHYKTTSNFSTKRTKTLTYDKEKRGRIICITSGKGGVGKTCTAASFGYGLAEKEASKKICIIDFDIGLRNLDIHLGIERRIIFDFVNVLYKECTLHQALVKDKRCSNLYMLAASQTRDKECLTSEGVEEILYDLSNDFDYIVLDSPAGIESGARHAMYFADDAIIVTNPELSSVKDADRMIGYINAKSKRSEIGAGVFPVNQMLLITRYDPERVEKDESLSVADITNQMGLPLVGVIPESKDVLTCTNAGNPVITLGEKSSAAAAYVDMVHRYCGEDKEFRFLTPQPKSFIKRLFG